MNTPLLELSNVSAFYGPIQALSNVSLKVDPGEIVVVIGANGAGKSTMLMSVFGVPGAKTGSIRLDGIDITRLPTEAIARKGVSIAPEGRRIFSGMTVRENLLLGVTSLGAAHLKDDMDKMLEMFPRLGERLDQRAGTMSGGEQQMLSIARALMSRPRILLLDEPSLGLAPMVVSFIFERLQDIAKDGTAILLVEQNAYAALEMANRAYVVSNGTISMSGSGRELLENPEIVGAYLG